MGKNFFLSCIYQKSSQFNSFMAQTFQILYPLSITMPRAKQAKLAEPKKRTGSTKSVADEELPPKRAKALMDQQVSISLA